MPTRESKWTVFDLKASRSEFTDEQDSRFISQYIFPGGYLPSTMELLDHISTQSKGTLTVERVENIGGHYTKTLRLWRENFLLEFDEKIKSALLESHPAMSNESIEVFRRKWEVRISQAVSQQAKRISLRLTCCSISITSPTAKPDLLRKL
jgi:cyclopropane fatty-acyl-phospholipid synthase-like methyltransferase